MIIKLLTILLYLPILPFLCCITFLTFLATLLFIIGKEINQQLLFCPLLRIANILICFNLWYIRILTGNINFNNAELTVCEFYKRVNFIYNLFGIYNVLLHVPFVITFMPMIKYILIANTREKLFITSETKIKNPLHLSTTSFVNMTNYDYSDNIQIDSTDLRKFMISSHNTQAQSIICTPYTIEWVHSELLPAGLIDISYIKYFTDNIFCSFIGFMRTFNKNITPYTENVIITNNDWVANYITNKLIN
jgi:hypothetical protein